MVIGLIPARRGSGKNMRLLGGHPLLAWTLQSARWAKALDTILVSTNNPDAMRLAAKAEATVLLRPEALCGDLVPDLPVVEHALASVEAKDDDILVLLRPTAPFRRASDIDAAVEFLRSHPEVSSIRSVVVTAAHPQKLYREAGFRGLDYTVLVPYSPHHWANGPRQVLERVWSPCGHIDSVRAVWPMRGSMEGPMIAALPVLAEYAVDLDTNEHWEEAEALIAARGWSPGTCE